MVFGRLHVGASALTSGGFASDNGWLASIADTGECRKIVCAVMAMCFWRCWPVMFGITVDTHSGMRVSRSG